MIDNYCGYESPDHAAVMERIADGCRVEVCDRWGVSAAGPWRYDASGSPHETSYVTGTAYGIIVTDEDGTRDDVIVIDAANRLHSGGRAEVVAGGSRRQDRGGRR